MLSDGALLELLLSEFPEAVVRDSEDYVDDGRPMLYLLLADVRIWIRDNLVRTERDVPPAVERAANRLLARVSEDRSALNRFAEQLGELYRDVPPPRLYVRDGCEERFARFWELMEMAAEDADGGRRQLLAIELHEPLFCTDEMAAEYLGPLQLELRGWQGRVAGGTDAAGG
jgi:hypothetical protein